MAVKFANLASTTLSSAITNSATSVAVADASLFPTLGSGDYFYATIGEGGGSEIVKVTAISSNTLTVTRAQDGTTASAFSSGETIALRVVAAALDDIASQAQTAADTESVSIDGDTMTGALIVRDSSSGATAYQNGNAGITIERNGRAALNFLTPATQDAYIFWGDPSKGNQAYLGYEHAYDKMTIKSAGWIETRGSGLNVKEGAVQVGGVEVISSSRNATLGTISSGAITSSGTITLNGTDPLVRAGTYDYLDFDDDSQTYTSGTNATVLASISDLTLRTNTNDGGGGLFRVSTGGSSPTSLLDITSGGAATFSGDVTVSGNLTVSGTTTTIDTANLNVEDNNITLNYSTGDSSATANGAGITIQDAVNSTTDATILWNATQDRFDISHTIISSGNIESMGFLQHYGYLYSRTDLRVLNAAANGWNTWATRSNGQFNLSVGTISSNNIAVTSSGTGAKIELTRSDTSASGVFLVGSSFSYIGTTTDKPFKIYQNNASALEFNTNKDAAFAGNVTLDRTDGFMYLSNIGTGNSGIYVRGIGGSDTLRSHSTGNFKWEVLGSQKMELDSGGNLDVAGRVKVTNWLELESAGAANTSQEAGIRIDYNDSPLWYIYKDNANDAALHIQSAGASGEGDGSPRVRFARTSRETYFGGSVGINRYNINSGYALDVNGSIRTDALAINGTTVIDANRNLTNIVGLYGNGGTLNHYNTNHYFKSTTSNLQAHISDTGLGIGTSPSNRLHVHSGSSSDIAKFQNNNGSFILGHTSGLTSIDLPSSGSLRIRYSGTELVRFGSTTAKFNGDVQLSNNTEKFAAAVYRRNAVASIDNTGYTTLFTVDGNNLGSAIRMNLTGTTSSVVVNVTADIMVGHYQDILITSRSGFYTIVTLKVTSNNNEDFAVEAKTNSANALTVRIEVFPESNENVTFTNSHSFTGSSHEHQCYYGTHTTGTGGNDGDFRVGGRMFIQDGTASSGGLVFADDHDTGFYRHTTNDIGVATAGAVRARFGTAGMTVYNQLRLNDTNTQLVEGAGNSIRLKTNNGYVDIGPQNSSWAHFETDRASFYFNKKLTVNSGIIESYDEDLTLRRAQGTAHQIQIKDTGVEYKNTGGQAKLTIQSSDTADSYINFSAASNEMSLGYDKANNRMAFTNHDTLDSNIRMVLGSAGDWVVSNTNPRVASQFNNQAGMGWYESDLHAEIATTGNRSALELGRNNSTATGDFLVFRKQATVIGSVGVEGGDSLFIQSSGSTGGGLRFHSSGRISPVRASAVSNNAIDLGASTQQFANLYLGSGLYMSGSEVINSSRGLTNITGLNLSSSTTSGMKATFTDSTANAGFYGFHIDYNASGSDTTTGDRIHAGLYIDADSSASGGGTSHEHRFYGAYVDVTASGDSDIIDGGFFGSRANDFGTGNQVTYLRGVNTSAVAHHNAGTVSNTIGVYGWGQDSSSGSGQSTNVYGGYFNAYAASTSSYTGTNFIGVKSFAQISATQNSNIATATAVWGEVQFDNDAAADHNVTISNAYVFRAEYDENDADDSYTVNNGYLYYGNYAGALPTTAWGVYIADNVPNYFGGTIRTSDGSTSTASYGFIGDVNTGMYSPANHELGFLQNGTQRLKIDANGATVSGKLVIKSSSNGFAKIEGTDANHMIIMRGNRDSTSTGTDMTTYYQYGGTRANGKGHLFYTGGALASQTLKLAIHDDAVVSHQPFHVTGGNIHSDNTIQLLTIGSAAQNIRTKSVFAGTSYGDTPPAGSFNATNTYELNGTTVIDSSRNLTNIGTYSGGGDVVAQAANVMFHARSSADGQTVGYRAGYTNHGTLQAFFRYTTGDAQLYIDNDFQGNNGVYSNINFRNKANGGSSLINRLTIHGSTGNVNVTGGNFQMSGTTVITSSRVLQNVTANANIITSGTFGASRIPNLDASKITSGTISDARLPTVSEAYNLDIKDTRSSQLAPSDVNQYKVSAEFTNQITSGWHSLIQLKGWHDGYTTWQLIGPSDTSAHDNLYFRSGVGSSWGTLQRIFHDGYHPNADRWTTSRAITLSGDVTGSVSFNGSQNVTMVTTASSSIPKKTQNENISGHWEWQDSQNIRLGNGADFRMWHNGEDHYFKNYNHAHGDMLWQGEDSNGQNRAMLYMITGTSGPYVQLFQTGNEKLRTVSAGINVYGDLTATGNVTAYSDIRKKKNITKLEGGLDIVNALEPKRFDWIESGEGSLGFIAQEVEEYLPELVDTKVDDIVELGEDEKPIVVGEEEVKSLDYGKMVSVLWAAVKEQSAQIETLNKRIEELENGNH